MPRHPERRPGGWCERVREFGVLLRCYRYIELNPLSAYRDIFTPHVDDELIADIREATERSRAFGDDHFIREMEARSGTRLRKGKPRPKPKSETGTDTGKPRRPGQDELLL